MSINDIIAEYAKANAEKKEAEKREEHFKALLESYANGNKTIDTDKYFVTLTERIQKRIDTKAVLKDFPEFKDVYGKITSYNLITIAEKASETKTA